MKNKLVFRIIGALSSALIIASVFIPFVSVTGYSQSLWQTHDLVGTLYLPITIIVFGVIGVLVFSTNFKTELAYASAGGLLFFLIVQTIPVLDQGTFNALGVGYYCLVIGTLLLIIMAFLCGLRSKHKNVENSLPEETKEISMIDQIDKLYSDQPVSQTITNENNLDNVIQPITVVGPAPVNNVSVENESKIESQVSNNAQSVMVVNEQVAVQNMTNVSENTSVNTNINTQIPNTMISNVSNPTNPVISEFSNPMPTVTPQSNPVVAEFNQIPVIQSQPSIQQNLVPEATESQPMQPVLEDKKVDVLADPTNNSSNLDIFG